MATSEGVKAVLFCTTAAAATRITNSITLPAGAQWHVAPRSGAYHDGSTYVVVSLLTDIASVADTFHAQMQAIWTSGSDASRTRPGSYSKRFTDRSSTAQPDTVTERRTK